MANLLYVDNSNVWIEGMYVAAAKHGLAPDVGTAVQQKICDYNWKSISGSYYSLRAGTAQM